METLPLVLGTIFAPLLGFLIAILLLINCPRVAQTVVLAGSALSVAGSAALLIRTPSIPCGSSGSPAATSSCASVFCSTESA